MRPRCPSFLSYSAEARRNSLRYSEGGALRRSERSWRREELKEGKGKAGTITFTYPLNTHKTKQTHTHTGGMYNAHQGRFRILRKYTIKKKTYRPLNLL